MKEDDEATLALLDRLSRGFGHRIARDDLANVHGD